ncbi:MAG: T9SS type A sorting domain-containing protein, partial [Flavobacteriales bacterium]|nr:T9SS type A sorting domain-containing protein [Flavobacteriales bacterium]
GLQWDYADLMPFESRSIVVSMQINPPTDPENPVNIDDVLVFTSVILPQAGDEMVQDNTFVFNQTVVGSYDPNDITCLQGDVVPPSEIGNYLHYVIRFENTGNAPAENIVVKVEIDSNQFDTNSLQMLSSSHDAYVRMNGNKIEFIFENIQLESGGHGNILLKMKTKPTLQVGDMVAKKANIYFDYNFPIVTNEAETLFQALSVVNPVVDNLISIYPNPVKDVVNITIKENSTIKTIELYDVQGRLLQTQLVNDVHSELNVSSRANGLYFIKINTDKGTKVEKLVKE